MGDNPYQAPAPVEATLADDPQLAVESAESMRRLVVVFHGLLALYPMLIVATIVSVIVTEEYLPEDLQAYLEIEESLSDALLLVQAAVVLPAMVLSLVGCLGMFFFWRASRWLFLAAEILFIPATILIGPSVEHGMVSALDGTIQLVSGGILAMAFFSPVRIYFAKR